MNLSGAPLIGVSAYCEQARWGVWEREAVVLPRRYVDAVAAAGGIPVLLPPEPGIGDALARLDGLMLSGCGDIDPARYGAQPSAQLTSVRAERDAAEFALLDAAMSLRLPVLGICRGMQVINVARGGSLHQHLPDVVGHDGHAPVPGAFGQHEVRVAAGSRLSSILGPDAGPAISTPTHHHQAVDRLGKGLTATAWAADGTIEAFEADGGDAAQFLVAVQWHPEAGDDPTLFLALVAAARAASLAAAPLAEGMDVPPRP
jgi:putative glutamine amidotransferase